MPQKREKEEVSGRIVNTFQEINMEKAKESMENQPIIDGFQIPEKQVLQRWRGKVEPKANEVDKEK